jgi:hypothetical protein
MAESIAITVLPQPRLDLVEQVIGTVEIITPGPQGAPGPQGPAGESLAGDIDLGTFN